MVRQGGRSLVEEDDSEEGGWDSLQRLSEEPHDGVTSQTQRKGGVEEGRLRVVEATQSNGSGRSGLLWPRILVSSIRLGITAEGHSEKWLVYQRRSELRDSKLEVIIGNRWLGRDTRNLGPRDVASA